MLTLPDWPLYGLADDVRPALAEARRSGRAGVLATLHTVVGGAPRPPGSQMLIVGDDLHGYLSGGCIEGDIAARAVEVLATGAPGRLVYGDGGPFPDIRLVCGGRVEILLEAIPPDDPAVETLLTLWRARSPALWASDGRRRRCIAAAEVQATPLGAASAGTALPGEHVLETALTILQGDPAIGCVVVGQGDAVGRRYAPTPRLIVVGGDPTALAIASLGQISGLQTWIVRPKGPEAPPPLPGVIYDRRPAELAFAAIGLDPWTSVAVATHDLEADEDALVAALSAHPAYVGVLGARRRLPERLERLKARGVSDLALARLRAPIGLNIGGKAPFEVAVSVMAEVMACAHGV